MHIILLRIFKLENHNNPVLYDTSHNHSNYYILVCLGDTSIFTNSQFYLKMHIISLESKGS